MAKYILLKCQNLRTSFSSGLVLEELGPAPARRFYAHAAASFRRLSSNSLSQEQQPQDMSSDELQIAEKLKKSLDVRSIEVRDTTGGCGSFYSVTVIAGDFKYAPQSCL